MRNETIHCDRCGRMIDNSAQSITHTDSTGTIKGEYDLCRGCLRLFDKFFKAFLATMKQKKKEHVFRPE